MSSNRTRVTGMYSGLDTESLISQLVEAKSTKVTSVKKDQMAIKYKQDAWTDLNKKVKSLFSNIGNLRFESSYSKKATEVSNSSIASVTASDTAMVSTQKLEVLSLAQNAYMTGAELKFADDAEVEEGEKITSGTLASAIGVSGSLTIKVGDGEEKTIDTTDKSIGQILSELSKEGVEANFDANNQRIFIGAKKDGADGNFVIGGAAAAALGLTEAAGAVQIEGKNGSIKLNDVTYSSNNNVYNVNGLTVTAKALTQKNEPISIKTTKDTSAIYDMIKKFVTDYTSLVNEMDKLYNATSNTKYKPLTDEEKAAMSDYEVEKWEEKLKELALSKDDNINSLSTALRDIMNQGFEVNGKTMYLFDFGIEAQNYTEAAENEKHAFHIKGDADDSVFASDENMLQYMITSDPDAVTSFFTSLSKELYSKMDEISARENGVRSYGSFFDDVKLKTDYSDYTTKLADMEAKLQAYEDKWYDKFSKMESAMAKMQSNQNAVSSLLGGA